MPSSAPLLVLWEARALYVGSSFGLSAHRNAVAVLAIGTDSPFEVACDPHDPKTGYRSIRSALIAANSLHHLRSRGQMAFLYLDPLSRDYEAVSSKVTKHDKSIAFHLENDETIADDMRKLAEGELDWQMARNSLIQNLNLHAARYIDVRIAGAMTQLREHPTRVTAAADFARDYHMSVSRFLHLFSEATGVPFRRYRLWCRLAAALRAAKTGASLTDAALSAGLSDSAHLSSAFRDMFGLAPSELNIQSLRLIEAE